MSDVPEIKQDVRVTQSEEHERHKNLDAQTRAIA